MEKQLAGWLDRTVRYGSLLVRFASGATRTFGDGTELPITLRFADAAAERLLVLDPALRFGELYMDGRLIVEEGTVFDLVSLLMRNGLRRAFPPHVAALTLGRIALDKMRKILLPERARRNVAHHYDLRAELFDLFLDSDRQYSCAYFEEPTDDLETAQLAKKRHIAAKLMLQPGNHVLDIGCGWGGLAIYLAETTGVRVTGITLSEEQLALARRRVSDRGLNDRVSFSLQDYRSLEGPFDRIVSVGMFEHVGTRNYRTFFRKAAAILERRDGVMLLHSIGRPKPTHLNQPWSEKYIFPGGYIPAVSEVLPSVEKANLLVKDIEILPMHYAWTLQHWRERFVSNRAKVVAIYDERFFRMWELYLAISETAFRHDRLFIFQMQLARHQDAVPVTRGYQARIEAQLAQQET